MPADSEKVTVQREDLKTVAAAAQFAVGTQPVESWRRSLDEIRAALASEGVGDGLRSKVEAELEHQRAIHLTADQESMHLGADGNLEGEKEAKLVARIAGNTIRNLQAALTAAPTQHPVDGERQGLAEYAEERAKKCELWLADPKETGREELAAAINAYRDVRDYILAAPPAPSQKVFPTDELAQRKAWAEAAGDQGRADG